MTKQEAQELMTYLELGWSIPDCTLFVRTTGGEVEVSWIPEQLQLWWNEAIWDETNGVFRSLGLGYVLENPENYSWRKIRGGLEFTWNGLVKDGLQKEPKTTKFFWRKLCDFGIGID